MKKIIKRVLAYAGYSIRKISTIPRPPPTWEFTSREHDLLEKILKRRLTMTPRDSLEATMLACKFVFSNDVKGDFVECGVWRGGHSMVAAASFQGTDRLVWMYDTFEGMTQPTEKDVSLVDAHSAIELHRNRGGWMGGSNWANAPMQRVLTSMNDLHIPTDKLRMIKGRVEDTLRQEHPALISVLRLDTDWYESTKEELEVLYPLLNSRGVLIVDDYGSWSGARLAVDEFFSNSRWERPFFIPLSNGGRIGIKL